MTVWEPGLGAVATMAPGLELAGPLARGFDPAMVSDVDHEVEDRAAVVAMEGARLGRSLGLEAEAHAIEDQLNVRAMIADVAAQRSAAAVVIGSHGLFRPEVASARQYVARRPRALPCTGRRGARFVIDHPPIHAAPHR